MEQAELQTRHYTPEEYFALERESTGRHEYYEGEVVAMAGAGVSHNLIKGNMIAALRPEARGNKCRVLDENVRLVVKEGKLYTYPDVLLSCNPADRHDPY